MKKLLAILLTVAMLFSVVYVVPTAVAAEEIETPVEAMTDAQFGVEEVDDDILEDEATDEVVLYAEREKYVGDKVNKENSFEKIIENYEASFASALSSYIDIDEFKEFVIDAFDTCTTSQVSIYSFRIPVSKWDALCDLVFYDIPELFHVTTLSGSQNGSYIGTIQVKTYPTYCDTATEYATLYNRSLEVAYQLLSGIRNNNNLTDLQKMILLHDRIATYCEYDPNEISSGVYRDQDYGMTGVFVDKVAVCQGYACAYNFLLKEVGIESYQCRSTDLCHAWNLVKVGNYFYHVDITWDDTYSDALDIKGRVFHTNFLRSNTGIRNTGHSTYDYDTPTNNSTYDSYFWQNSDAEFVLVGNQVYYYDKTCGDLKTYSGTVKSNQATWAYGRILADGNYIYISTASDIKRYDTTTNTTTTIYTPALPSNYEIYSLYKNGSYIYCGVGSTSSSTLTPYQVSTSTPDTPTPSTNTLTANNSYSASITSGGQEKVYSFTPNTTGKYVIYSTASDDTYVTLCNSSGSAIASDDDDGDSTNFRLEYNLTAGTTYQYKIRFYNSSYTGTIPFKFGNVFTIRYNANGGSGAPSSQEKDYGASVYLSEDEPTRSGYIFRGWNTSSTATSATYQPGDTFSDNAETTLYAVWSSNGTTITANNSYNASITSGGQEKIYLFTPTTSGKYVIYSTSDDDTYVTLCNANGSELDYNDDGGNGNNFRLEYNLTAGTTYQYKVRFYNSSYTGTIPFKFGKVFTIRYNANGGSGAPSNQEKDYGASIYLSDDEPTRSGYIFRGWSTSSTATSATYQPGDAFSTDVDTTLYAVWAQDTNILSVNRTYAANITSGGQEKTYRFTPSTSGRYVIYSTGSEDTYVSLCNASGNVIASDDDGGTDVNFRLAYNLTAGTTYYYKVRYLNSSNTGTISFTFGNVYTITYNVSSVESQEKDYGASVQITYQTPVRSGYTFLGWDTSSSATTVVYEPGDTYSNNANITLYAVWEGGSNLPTISLNSTYRVTISNGSKLVQFTPSKTAKYVIHSTFIESYSDSQDTKVWLYDENGALLAQDDDSGEGLKFLLIYELQAGHTYTFEMSFYNQNHGGTFEFIFGETYEVKYSANGGKSAPKATLKGYSAGGTLSSWLPSRSGYIFLGWATSKTAKTATYKRGGTLPANINRNITLYAVWKKGSLGATAVLKGKLLDYNTIKVFWREVPGADGYKVYYKKASAKSYKYSGIVTGTSYTGDFTAGTKYNFKVIPCIRKNDGKYTDGKAKTLTYLTGRLIGAPSWLNANLYGYDDVMLKWGKVSYATHYKIYYKKNNASSYTYKGVTKSTSYKMANLTDGALYTFAVLPCLYVNGAYLEATHYRWIEKYTLKKVPTPTISEYSSTRITLYWSNILGESGYQISKSTSSKGTNVIHTGTVSSYDSPGGYYYKDISAPYGKTYYYKVRAYTVENGKKIYGPWSTVVKYKMT